MRFAVKTQHNLWLDIFIVIIVIALAIWLRLDLFKWAIIIITIGFVLSMEVLNTAIEKLTDMVSPEWSDKAGLVKDLVAAAVLLSAIAALVIGILILGPPLLEKLRAIF